jgi:dihydropteroate synthase
MGILNVTPDSFSDGGRYNLLDAAIEHAAFMVEEGASLIDIGGESTRPGALPVAPSEEIDRVMPVLEALRARFDVVLSIDTSSPALMREASKAGAGMLNDVRAFSRQGAEAAALEAAQQHGVALAVMHMQGEPTDMQVSPVYGEVTSEVVAYLRERLALLGDMGVPKAQLVADPGFGFGKTLEHNYVLLKNLPQFTALGVPLLVGVSRKSMIGIPLGKPAHDRVFGSVAAALLAVERGAVIVRVHDVGPTVDALKIRARLYE